MLIILNKKSSSSLNQLYSLFFYKNFLWKVKKSEVIREEKSGKGERQKELLSSELFIVE